MTDSELSSAITQVGIIIDDVKKAVKNTPENTAIHLVYKRALRSSEDLRDQLKDIQEMRANKKVDGFNDYHQKNK